MAHLEVSLVLVDKGDHPLVAFRSRCLRGVLLFTSRSVIKKQRESLNFRDQAEASPASFARPLWESEAVPGEWAYSADVADFMLNQVESDTYLSSAVGVCW